MDMISYFVVLVFCVYFEKCRSEINNIGPSILNEVRTSTDNSFASLDSGAIPLENSRIQPSDHLPIGEMLSGGREPTIGDINPKRLRRILTAKKFNHEFMSVKRPSESVKFPNGSLYYNLNNGHPRGRMPAQLKSLSLSSDRGKQRVHDKQVRHTIRKFLWNYSYCPVLYKWRDLGLNFWPRWIKEGRCYNGRSCSIPAGMSCKQKDHTFLTLLYWHCKQNCYWMRIQYPIISSCACGC